MFHTFNFSMTDAASSRRPQSRPAGSAQTQREHSTRRSTLHSQTFRACKRCRLYHIKCGQKPCEPCRINNARCVWRQAPSTLASDNPGSPSPPAPSLRAWPSVSLDTEVASAASSSTHVATSYSCGVGSTGANLPPFTTTQGNSSSTSSASTPISPGWGELAISTPLLTSSPTSRACRVRQLFRDLAPVQASDDSHPNPFPILPQVASNHGNVSDGLAQGAEPLNRDKQAYFVRLFWTSWGPLFPVMTEAEFESLFTANWPSWIEQRTIEGAMIDGMTALGIQCGQAAGVGGRILGLESDADRRSSLEYFKRCRDHLRAEDSSVTVSSIRCYILLVLYELQANRVESAYYMAGLGVRRAHMCKLHLAPPAHVDAKEATGRIRTWWLLYWLDIHCSMQLDRPAGVQRSSITCPPPPDRHGNPPPGEMASGWAPRQDSCPSTYSCCLSKLTISIAEALEAMPTIQSLDEQDTVSTLEEPAERLFYTMRHLAAFLTSLPKELVNPRETTSSGYNSPSLENREGSALSPSLDDRPPGVPPVALMLGVPDWLQRQRIMLELYYYNACVLLQRPFVLWQQGSGPSTRSASLPRTKYHADYAVQHACSIISILYSIYTKSDIMDGLTMVFQYLWNAITTLVVQSFVDPQSPQTARLSEPLSSALAILESLSRTNLEALHIYQVSRSLVRRLRDTNETNMSIHPSDLRQRLEPPSCFASQVSSAPSSEDSGIVANRATHTNELDSFMGSDYMIPEFDTSNFNVFNTYGF
ncbi:fungal-specific transcription factor [Xylariaceae sp. FL0662B]|nr:fungal-specific transcription factor [Xylariaceae sp. FL0662B]